MAEYKKIIAGFGCRAQTACSWTGKTNYQASLAELAKNGCDNGADQILVYDRSAADEEHEAVIGQLRTLCRETDAPVIVGGRVKRLEDVKKYLYAGAEMVFLDMSREEERAVLKEAADRFGKERLAAFLPDLSLLEKSEEYGLKEAGTLLIRSEGAVPSLHELEIIGNCEQPCLIFAAEENDLPKLAANLKLTFGCEKIFGAVLTLSESRIDSSMELKQLLKSAGVSVHTFCSALEWSDFKLNSDGLIPVVVQDYKTNQVLMVAYMNQEAFEATLATGRMTYFSRSRQSLWLKGETSGHFQYVKSLAIDCDRDTILAVVKQVGAACHTGNTSCFYTPLAEKEYKQTNPLKVFEEVFQVIQDRKVHPKEGSYTNYLFDKGIDKILKKVGEEATEIVIAAKNSDPVETVYELSDFLYHAMVLMAEKGISWEDVTRELANR